MIPRPKWNDPEVQASAVKDIIEPVTGWVKASVPHIDLSSEESIKYLTALITLAVQESADAYGAGRYLDTMMDWPVDAELIRILDKVYGSLVFRLPPFIHAWVMQEKVRFPAKVGDFVKFKVGTVTMQGTVSAVIPREARGIIEVKTGPSQTKHMSVNAEDITSHTKGLSKTAGGSPNPPTGGTPVAARGGAILKEAKAA